MRILKLAADYYSYPLWNISPGEYYNVNPSDLPLSLGLQDRLNNWAQEFDNILNEEDPSASKFKTVDAEKRFSLVADELQEDLERELGSSYQITRGSR